MAQHDYSIANQGFPATRGDINDALSAISTSNSGTSAPSTQFAGQFWLDTNTPSGTTWTLYFHDGTDDITFATIDTSANTVNFSDSAPITALNNPTANELVTVGATTTELDAETNLTFDGTTLAVAGNTTITTADNTDTLKLVSTDADASHGPVLVLHRDSGSPAANDVIGDIHFSADSDAAAESNNALITATALDVSHGSESGQLDIQTRLAGTGRSRIKMNATETVFNDDSVDLDFRVESDDSANALFLEGSSGNVGMGVPPSSTSANGQTIKGLVLSGNTANGVFTGLQFLNRVENATTSNGISIDFDHKVDASTTIPLARILGSPASASAGDLRFYTSTSSSLSERMHIDSSGNVEVKTGNLVIGTAGKGIDFSAQTASTSGTTTSEVLDHYEEGTWTPTIRDIGGNLATLSIANGSYTKIGRWVQINFQITLSSKGSMTGNYVLMGGIPFNHPTASYNGTGVIDYWNNFATSYSGLWFDTSSTGSVMWLNAVAAAGGTNSVMPNVAAINDNSHMKGSCMYQISV